VGSLIDPAGVGNITAHIGGAAALVSGVASGQFTAHVLNGYAWTDGSGWDYQNWRLTLGTGEPSGDGPAPAGVQLWPDNAVNASNPQVGGSDTRGWNDVSAGALLSGYVCKF